MNWPRGKPAPAMPEMMYVTQWKMADMEDLKAHRDPDGVVSYCGGERDAWEYRLIRKIRVIRKTEVLIEATD